MKESCRGVKEAKEATLRLYERVEACWQVRISSLESMIHEPVQISAGERDKAMVVI
jgi:hypothetical protein